MENPDTDVSPVVLNTKGEDGGRSGCSMASLMMDLASGDSGMRKALARLVRAEGSVIQGGRRLAYCAAKLVGGDGKLICHATGSCLICPRELPRG